MPYVFSLINPPSGFSINNDGDILIAPDAPAYSGVLSVRCVSGANSTTANINFNWFRPTTSAMFTESGNLDAVSKSNVTIEGVDMLIEALQTSSISSVILELLNVAFLNVNSLSTVTIEADTSAPGITAAGLTWSLIRWDAGYNAVVGTNALARSVEIYYPIGTTAPTDFDSLVCNTAIQVELLTSVQAFFGDTAWTYDDCLDAAPGDSEMQATTPYSAIYYFTRP